MELEPLHPLAAVDLAQLRELGFKQLSISFTPRDTFATWKALEKHCGGSQVGSQVGAGLLPRTRTRASPPPPQVKQSSRGVAGDFAWSLLGSPSPPKKKQKKKRNAKWFVHNRSLVLWLS